MQKHKAGELRQKEVINISDATRLGFVSDVEVSVEKGLIEAIIVPGKAKLFNFSANKDFFIPWNKIKAIGEDVILVEIGEITVK